MRNLRKRALLGALAAAAALALPGAWAQTWPSRSVSIIVPFPAGGTTDVLARALGQELSKTLGQPVVVENKPGAGATLGADYVAKAKADGYTLLMGAVHHTIATSVYRKLGYDFEKDFAPITTVALVPNVLVVNPQVPAKTVQELLAQAKAQSGKLTYGSNGTGTGQHLIGAQFEGMGGVQLLHVPYKGSGPAVTDMLGGQVDLMFDSITSARPHIQAGKLRALGVTSAKRSATLPDVPTIAEAGVPGYEVSPWFAVFAPAGTPAAIVNKINAALIDAMKQPDTVAKFETIGAEPIGTTPQQLATHLDKELARWGALIKERNIRMD